MVVFFVSEGDWAPIARNYASSTLSLPPKKKTIPEKRFSGSKVSKFSLTNPTSSSLSDQEAVALRLAPAGRRKGVLCKMSYADS